MKHKKLQIITDAVDRCMSRLADCRRGDFVPWHVVEQESGFERETQHWDAFWHGIKRDYLQRHGVGFRVIDGQGFALMTVDEQITLPVQRRTKKAMRQLARVGIETGALPDAELTMHQRMRKYAVLESSRESRSAMQQKMKLNDYFDGPRTADIPREHRTPEGES